MLRNAHVTAQSDGGPERKHEAIRQVHLAMYRFALGQITEDERKRLLSILRPCCPEVFVSPANEEGRGPMFSIPEEFYDGSSLADTHSR